MKKQNDSGHLVTGISPETAVSRLTALWALNEAGLGGIMHALKIPFTGLFIGGMAMIIITLIAYFSRRDGGAILKGLLLVLIVKAGVSPHSPVTAYFAVSFQAVMGALLFRIIPAIRLAAVLLCAMGMLESAGQKLIHLTVIYGRSLWEAIDLFASQVVSELGGRPENMMVEASFWLIILYLGIYTAAGIMTGLLAGKIPSELSFAMARIPAEKVVHLLDQTTGAQNMQRSGRRFWKRWLIFLTPLILIIPVMIFMFPGNGGARSVLYLMLRVMTVFLTWFYLLAPVSMYLLKRLLRRR
ncbi:MAG: hypothetical protein JW861_06310 [Bacteroidales bacterium]|nr:hypothetical protein [Bacteroidales bacterium]